MKAAEDLLQQERFALAAEYLGRILHKDPGNVEIWKMQAVAYARMALSSLDPTQMAHAEVVLRETVNMDWEWETGHQFRIQIAEKAERLDELVREYRSIAQEERSERSAMAVRMIQVIQLTLQFKSISAGTGGEDSGEFWKGYLGVLLPMFVGLIFVALSAQGAIRAFNNREPIVLYLAFVLASVLGTAFLVVLAIRKIRSGGQGPRRRKTP